MALISIVKLSELEGAKRTDAEYYQPQHINLVSRMKEHRTYTLRSMGCEVVSGPFGSSLKSEAYLSEGVPFIRIQNLLDFFIDKQDLVYISAQDNERLRNSQLKAGDLVLSKVGNTIGVVSIVTEDIGNCNISENNIGIRFTRGIQAPVKSYVLTYLNSKLGRHQILRRISGNAQPKLNVRDISEMLINVPSEGLLANVDDLIRNSKVLIDLAASLYSQAENLLLEELGLKDFQPKYELSYSANLSKAFGAHRIDAEHFQPAYEEIVNHLSKNFVTEKLKDIVSLLKHGRQPYYVEGGEIPILIQKHLGSQYVNLDALNDQDTPRTDRKFIEKYPEYKVQSGDVLFYSVGAYLGRTNVLLTQIDAVPASFITLIRTKKKMCSPMFLAVFLNSKVGQLQSGQWKSASAQQYIYPKDIGDFIIPILPDKTQQKIALLVERSYEARKKARQLLEEAKSKVENLIEGTA